MEIFEYRGMQVQLIAKTIKHCYLRIKPDGLIMLTHNKWVKKSAALELIDKNWSLIESKLAKLSKPNDLSLGNEIYFLGECYKLNIILDKKIKIEVIDNCVHLFTPKDEFEIKIKILNAWYLQQSKPILTKQYETYLNNISHWKIIPPMIRFRTMKRRWGSYNKTTNTVTLNTNLVKVNTDIIDYIIAHELCHIRHFNHSSAFYDELTRLHPTWREQKLELDFLSSKI
jgi:predicted metal-dependent hydrolase